MKTHRSKFTSKAILLVVISLLIIGCGQQSGLDEKSSSDAATLYQPTWTSLQQHETPAWLRDAKFGIYTHWGLSTLRYKEENRGKSQDELIELFNPENFDPAVWAKLFKDAGARFAGPIAWHGSNYLHWDSDISELNSFDRNPHIDIVGELEREIKKQGMKFFVSYHSIGRSANWIDLAREGVDKYSPDIFWVDASFGGTKGGHHMKILDNSRYIGEKDEFPGMLAEKYQTEFISYYYNHGEANGKEVEFVYKSYDIPPGVGMRDLENGLLPGLAYDTWMTDMDMNLPPDWATHGWFYRDGVPLRDADNIVDMLVDVVSKNGILLLNVPPLEDGTFPQEVRTTLLDVGQWLEVNGEAIYGSSPWFIYGEGPDRIEVGNYSYHHNDHFGKLHFNEEDIRFTVNGDMLYAICLGWPGESLEIRALNNRYKVKEGEIQAVSLLGLEKPITWRHTDTALEIDMPSDISGEHAYVFKIERD
ncbi:alpha-L-fucosidase [Bacteroidota bacterium]